MSSAKNPVVITASAHGHTTEATFTGSATVSQLLTAFGRIATGKRKITLELEVDSKMSLVKTSALVTKADLTKGRIKVESFASPEDMATYDRISELIEQHADKAMTARMAAARDASEDENGKLGLSERWTTSGTATKI